MRQYTIYQVDAFASQSYRGDPAGDLLIGVYVNPPLLAGRLPAGGSAELEPLQAHDLVSGLYFRCSKGAVREMPAIAGRITERYSADLEAGLHLFGFSAGGSAIMLALIESELRMRAPPSSMHR